MRNLTNYLHIKGTPMQAAEGIRLLLDTVKDNHRVTQEETTKRENIKAMKEYEIEKLRTQKDIIKDCIEKSFCERRENFDKLFQALDKGLENNDIRQIQIFTNAIADLAKNSPIKEVYNLINDTHNPDVKEITI